MKVIYYNIPSNNRELQQVTPATSKVMDYNIPSNSRELQQKQNGLPGWKIITYQVITGNYSLLRSLFLVLLIITYQVITGNYSYNVLWESSDNILKKYKWKRKSLAITPSDVNIFSQTSETLNGIAFKNIISQSQKNNTLNKRDHI